MNKLLFLFLLGAAAVSRAQTIDSMPAASSVGSTDLFIDDQAADSTTYHKASAAQIGTFVFGLSLSGDLSGTLASPTVAKFNGQLPSYYLNFTHLTNLPTTAAGYGIANGSVLDAWGIKTPYAGTFTLTTGKTFNVTNTLTLAGTDGSTLNFGAGGTLASAAFTALDTDGTLAANSNTRVPSQAAVVTYVASHASGGSSGLTTQTGTYYANAGDRIFNSPTGGLTYVYLPASPNDGDMVTIYDAGDGDESLGFDHYPCTVDANGSEFVVGNADYGASTLSLGLAGGIYIFVYSAEYVDTPGWTVAVISPAFNVLTHP